MIRKPFWIGILILAMSFSAFARQPETFKNLAGTPAEMSSMRLPDARTMGVKSKAAMLPIRFKNGKATLEFPVETTEDLRISLLAPNSDSWKIIASNESNKDINLRDNTELVDKDFGEVGMDGVKFPAEVFGFGSTKDGTWNIEISVPKGESLREDTTVGYLVVSSKSPYQIYTSINTHQTLVGKNIGISTRVFNYKIDGETALPTEIEGSLRSVTGEMTLPNGTIQKLSFDATGNSSFVPRTAGEYSIQIIVEGISPRGETFVRTSEQVVRVLNDNVRFGKSTDTELLDDTRLQINLPTSGLKSGRKVIVYGEIWNKNDNGNTPVAWLGGISVAEGKGSATNLPVTFDGRWLANADTKGGFELRNVRIQDADYLITLAESSKMELNIATIPENAKSFAGEINDEMRMGKRPELPATTNDAVGGRLMLIHGYCADGNSFPVSQFTGEIVFHDPNKNRSHDQFANLIKNFGASYPSFGIVAHSQGGAASLHLYTYYWSGLDSATGSRLIQSVGTPYQGTAIAGNLAALGNIFGAGCGYNGNLTESGATAWLAGIPSWARAKINYYTTSFTDKWYRYDYCSIATDLFLNDPDDGVIEKGRGQLSGALNRGHKTGWCHTTSMRDPGQTTDSSRNSQMNSLAAR